MDIIIYAVPWAMFRNVSVNACLDMFAQCNECCKLLVILPFYKYHVYSTFVRGNQPKQ